MSMMSSASAASLWRGYEYYKDKKVKSLLKLSDDEYEGEVSGSQKEPYRTKIDVAHIRQSKCNCPHADGKRVICKHMIALFFTAFPKEAENYIKEVEAYEREEEEREKEHYKEIRTYVYGLSKDELRQELINYIMESEEQRHYW